MKWHLFAHNSLPLAPIHTVQILSFHLVKIHSSLTLPSMPRSSQWFLPFKFPNHNSERIYRFSCASYITCPFQLPWFHHPNTIWWPTKNYELISASCNFLQSLATAPFWNPNICLTPCSQIYVLPLFGEGMLHLHAKWHEKLHFLIHTKPTHIHNCNIMYNCAHDTHTNTYMWFHIKVHKQDTSCDSHFNHLL